MAAEGTWQIIFEFLKEAGYEMYAPAQHTGECKTKYVVLKDLGTLKPPNISSTSTVYDVLCYVPKNQYSQMETFKDKVKSSMAELQARLLIRPTYTETPTFYDEEIKGFMSSIQYELFKKL